MFAGLLLLLVLVLPLGATARAQSPGVIPPVRDPQATPRATKSQADSVIVDSALVLPKSRVLQIADPNSPAARRARRDSLRVARMGVLDEPRYVMLRSLLVPGWGQLHNRAWFKAAIVAGGEGWFLSDILGDNRKLKDLDAELAAADRAGDFDARNAAVERYNARLDHMVGREWLLGGLLVYSLIDAYVDAHFVNFQFEFEHDSARPAGVRLGLEKHF